MKFLVVSSILALSATAFAFPISQNDGYSIQHDRAGHTIALSGGVKGAASELFTIFERAGFQTHQYVEGKQLEGRKLRASVFFLNGARYNAGLRIDNDSARYTIDTSREKQVIVSINGDVADELVDAMAKAGVPHRTLVDATVYTASHARCSVIYVGKRLASCQLRLETGN